MCDESGKVWWRNWTLARMGLGVFNLRFIGAADANAVDAEWRFRRYGKYCRILRKCKYNPK